MAGTKRDDIRLLSKDEQELVAQSRQPAVKKLTDQDLVDLARSLRQHRDRAQEMSKYLRREMRGQVGRSSLTTAGAPNGGTRAKLTLLVAAMKRANKEIQRRLGRARGPKPSANPIGAPCQ
jgi:hypothetical protein